MRCKIQKICSFVLILTIPTCSVADIVYFRSSKKRTCEILSISDSTFVIQSKKRIYDKRRWPPPEEIKAEEILAYKYSDGILMPVTIRTRVDSLAFNALVEENTPKVVEQKIGPLEMFFFGLMFYVVLMAIEEGRK